MKAMEKVKAMQPYFEIPTSSFVQAFIHSNPSFCMHNNEYKVNIQNLIEPQSSAKNNTAENSNQNMKELQPKICRHFKSIMKEGLQRKTYEGKEGKLYFKTKEQLYTTLTNLCHGFHCNMKIGEQYLPQEENQSEYPFDCLIDIDYSEKSLQFNFEENITKIMEDLTNDALETACPTANNNEDFFAMLGIEITNEEKIDTQNEDIDTFENNETEETNKIINCTRTNIFEQFTGASVSEKNEIENTEEIEILDNDNHPPTSAEKKTKKNEKRKTVQNKIRNDDEENSAKKQKSISTKESNEKTLSPPMKKRRIDATSTKEEKFEKLKKCSSESIQQIGIRALNCAPADLLEYLDAHTTDYVRDGTALFIKNSVKIINCLKAVWSFTQILKKLVTNIPFKFDPETLGIKLKCTGCALHCIEHMDIPVHSGRPPKDPLLDLKIEERCEAMSNSLDYLDLESPPSSASY